jgi:hypothetical protein
LAAEPRVLIDERFCGPPHSANGGYTSALTAAPIEGPAEVTLRVPPPLGREMTLRQEGARVLLLDGDVLVAEAEPTTVDLEVPEHVSFAQAARASELYPWREGAPYPTCFVCGVEREPGDGMRIFSGPVEGRALFAGPWTPDSTLAGADGTVRDEFVWAALDCPSGVVTDLLDDVGLLLLGRLAADLRRPVRAGEPHVVQAWVLGRDGRKLHTASAIRTGEGELCAVARAVWIVVAQPSERP